MGNPMSEIAISITRPQGEIKPMELVKNNQIKNHVRFEIHYQNMRHAQPSHAIASQSIAVNKI
jgi:hypothetical protein